MANSHVGSTAKAALRDAMRDNPVLWPPTSGAGLVEQLTALVGQPRVAACYLSYGDEAPTLQLRHAWREAGVRVMVPFLLPNKDLDWVLDDGGIVHGKAFTNPDGHKLGLQALAAAEVVVIPAMAVGEDGVRLGQGGGSYDRTLARLPREGRLLVALAHESRIYASGALPAERHDILVDAIVTPHRFIRCTHAAPSTPSTQSYMQHLLDDE